MFISIADSGIAHWAAPGSSDFHIGLLRARAFKQTPALQVNCCKFQYNLVRHHEWVVRFSIFNCEEEQDNSSPVSFNLHPSRATNNKHPPLLITDIENSGGIHIISLYCLCDLKPELYGEEKSAERKETHNLVNRWKQLTSKEYKKLLCNLLPDKYPSQVARSPSTPLLRAPNSSEDEDKDKAHKSPAAAASTSPFLASPLSTAIMMTTSASGSSTSKNVTYIQRILAANEYGKQYNFIAVVIFCCFGPSFTIK